MARTCTGRAWCSDRSIRVGPSYRPSSSTLTPTARRRTVCEVAQRIAHEFANADRSSAQAQDAIQRALGEATAGVTAKYGITVDTKQSATQARSVPPSSSPGSCQQTAGHAKYAGACCER